MRRLFLLALLAFSITGCPKPNNPPSAKKPPAKVDKLPLETEIGQITLTAEAEQRLGIAFTLVAEEDVQRRRTFGGDAIVPTAKSIAVSAPFAGTISFPKGGLSPLPGQRLELGNEILQIAPILTPEREVPTPAEHVQIANSRATLLTAKTVAQGDAQRANAEVEAATIALARAEKLFTDRAGSERAVDDARALLNVSQSVLNAAVEREKQLSRMVSEIESPYIKNAATALSILAPQSGILRTLLVTQGQAVTAGSPLFEIVDIDTIWVRVPIYVELLPKIDTLQDAQIVSLGAMSGTHEHETGNSSRQQNGPKVTRATAIAAPPSADPLSSSVDIYFECPNLEGSLRPGQRVGVQLALRGAVRGRTVPAEAIIYDINGGTWVYVRKSEHVFQRERVLIHYALGNRVVLAEGPTAGTQVVTDGVAELFGTEFGAGK